MQPKAQKTSHHSWQRNVAPKNCIGHLWTFSHYTVWVSHPSSGSGKALSFGHVRVTSICRSFWLVAADILYFQICPSIFGIMIPMMRISLWWFRMRLMRLQVCHSWSINVDCSLYIYIYNYIYTIYNYIYNYIYIYIWPTNSRYCISSIIPQVSHQAAAAAIGAGSAQRDGSHGPAKLAPAAWRWKMLCTPKPNGFADHYPYEKWLFHWEYTQHFQTNPYFTKQLANEHDCSNPLYVNYSHKRGKLVI